LIAATASESGWWQSFPDRLSWFRRSLLRRQEAHAGMSTNQFDPSQQKLVIFVAPAAHSDEQNAI
jgi:hypothetical protein